MPCSWEDRPFSAIAKPEFGPGDTSVRSPVLPQKRDLIVVTPWGSSPLLKKESFISVLFSWIAGAEVSGQTEPMGMLLHAPAWLHPARQHQKEASDPPTAQVHAATSPHASS